MFEKHRKSVAKLLKALFESEIEDDSEINKRLKSKAVDFIARMLSKPRKTVSICADFARKIGEILEVALYDEDLREKVIDIMNNLFLKQSQVEVMMRNLLFVKEVLSLH